MNGESDRLAHALDADNPNPGEMARRGAQEKIICKGCGSMVVFESADFRHVPDPELPHIYSVEADCSLCGKTHISGWTSDMLLRKLERMRRENGDGYGQSARSAYLRSWRHLQHQMRQRKMKRDRAMEAVT